MIGLNFQSLWRDEVDAILFASRRLPDLLHTFVQAGQNGPLYFLVLRPWLHVAGQSEFSLRFLSVVFGVLTVPMVYRLGRRLFASLPSAAVLAALLAATAPYLIWYSQEGKMYALVTFLILVAMDRYLAALKQGGWPRWLAYVLITTAAFYVHLIAALIIPAQMLVFGIVGQRDGRWRWKPWLASMIVLTVPYLPLLIWQLPLLLQLSQTGYRFVPLNDVLLSLLTSYSLGVIPSMTRWALLPFVALLLAIVPMMVVAPRWRASLAILLCWLLVPVLGFFLVTLVRPMYTARYLIFVLPAGLLLLAFALVAIGRRSRLIAGLLLVFLLVADGWALYLQATTLLKADFRAATRYVSRQLGGQDLVLFQIPHGRFSFDYYFEPAQEQDVVRGHWGGYLAFLPYVAGSRDAPYRWAEGLYTNSGMTVREVAQRMDEMMQGSRIVWLVATEVPMWDERNLVQSWLDKNGRLMDQAEFVRVAVYRYELR